MGVYDRIKLSAKDVPPVLRAAFPNYKGRKWSAEVTTKVQMYDTHYSGGTRNQYMAVDLETGHMAAPKPSAIGTGFDPKEPTVELEPGLAIVEHSMFMGKDVGITIYVHPANANVARALPVRSGGKRRHARGQTTKRIDWVAKWRAAKKKYDAIFAAVKRKYDVFTSPSPKDRRRVNAASAQHTKLAKRALQQAGAHAPADLRRAWEDGAGYAGEDVRHSVFATRTSGGGKRRASLAKLNAEVNRMLRK